MPASRRSRRLGICLLTALLSCVASLVLGLGGLDATLLDLLPFALLVGLMLAWPDARAALILAISRRPRRRRGTRPSSGRRRPRPLIAPAFLASRAHGARAPPLLLLSRA